jgi:NAD(P)-dependent dehydrogenase (short-subunit alcohol dehydrogenase family)
VAIVTGAAQAIGYATAWELALEGAAVTVADIQEERGMAVAAAMRADGRRALFVETDVGDPEQLERMVAATVAEFGRVDILVNNAALLGMAGTVAEETAKRWDAALAVNVRGVALGTKFAVAEMRRVGGGAIVNIASVHGFLVAERGAIYDTCKHAVIGLTRQAAIDLGPENIRVNAICPGFIMSERTEKAWLADAEGAAVSEAMYPLRRVGRPHDIAAAVRFLVSDDAAFVTGVALPVDGGMSVQLVDSVAGPVLAAARSGGRDGERNTPARREYP